MNSIVLKFNKKLLDVTPNITNLCYITRKKSLQVNSCNELKSLMKEANNIKQQMIEQCDEDSANFILSLELVIEMLISELEMWIALKENDPNKAWGYLINAQNNSNDAMKAYKIIEILNLKIFIQRYEIIEKIIFPPQIFFSTGIVVDDTICSICENNYEQCEHIAGQVYMGEFCTRIINKIRETREVSIVENPSDKNCRALEITDKNSTYDTMTLEMKNNDSEDENY